MLHIVCWVIALAMYEPGAAEATDWMKPPSWSGNYCGPAATRARSTGNLPPLQSNPEMSRWNRWGMASAWKMTRRTVWSSRRRRPDRRALHSPSPSGLVTGSTW